VFIIGNAIFSSAYEKNRYLSQVIQNFTVNRIPFRLPARDWFVLQDLRKTQLLCVAADFCSVLRGK